MIARLPDWRARLLRYLAENTRRPVDYGQFDCILFPADCVEAMTGVDLAAEWRGRYTTPRGGLRVLRKSGLTSPAALLDAELTPIPPAYASVGDLVTLPGEPPVPSLGLVQGARVYCVSAQGLVMAPLGRALAGWRVG